MIEQYMIWIWLGIFVFAIIFEAITQDLVSIWFALGAIIAMFASMFEGIPFWVEIILFSVISVVVLICTRPFVSKLMERAIGKTNADEFVGKRVKAITDITKFDAGKVKLNGIEYTAILMDDSDMTIPVETIVEIVAIKGNKVIVKELEKESI